MKEFEQDLREKERMNFKHNKTKLPTNPHF